MTAKQTRRGGIPWWMWPLATTCAVLGALAWWNILHPPAPAQTGVDEYEQQTMSKAQYDSSAFSADWVGRDSTAGAGVEYEVVTGEDLARDSAAHRRFGEMYTAKYGDSVTSMNVPLHTGRKYTICEAMPDSEFVRRVQAIVARCMDSLMALHQPQGVWVPVIPDHIKGGWVDTTYEWRKP